MHLMLTKHYNQKAYPSIVTEQNYHIPASLQRHNANFSEVFAYPLIGFFLQ